MGVEKSEDLERVALDALREVAGDGAAPPAARAAAARTLLEHVGAIGRNSQPKKPTGAPLSGMSRADMMEELAALRASRASQIS